jgi:streptogramin lyase
VRDVLWAVTSFAGSVSAGEEEGVWALDPGTLEPTGPWMPLEGANGLSVDRDGMLWAATSSSIQRIDPDTGSILSYVIDSGAALGSFMDATGETARVAGVP